MEPTPIPAGLEKLLDLVIKKCDDSKKDLEKNWTYQIIAVGVSVGLIFGLGQAISKHYLDEVGHERVLYLVLPLINLYLFMRFGFLASIFSDARLALEQLATTYFKLVELKEIDPALTLGSSVLSTTNSYFEFYHRGRPNLGVFLYSLFVPTVFAASHASSLFLLELLVGSASHRAPSRGILIVWILYLIPVLSLYVAYYMGNRDLTFTIAGKRYSFVRYSLAVCAILTAIFIVLLRSYVDIAPLVTAPL